MGMEVVMIFTLFYDVFEIVCSLIGFECLHMFREFPCFLNLFSDLFIDYSDLHETW